VSRPPLPFRPATLALLARHLGQVCGPVGFVADLHDAAAVSRGVPWRNPGRHGLWIVGFTASGDAWAVDVQEDERVVLLSHHLLCEGDVVAPRDALCAVADSLADALARAAAGTLPRSYFAAVELPPPAEPPPRDVCAGIPSLEERLAAPEACPDEAAVLAAIFGAGSGVTWERLDDAIPCLDELGRAVVSRRFGLLDGAPLSVAATAQTLGLTPDRVEQIEARGVAWLRRWVGLPGPG
jgi:hypothetical protein